MILGHFHERGLSEVLLAQALLIQLTVSRQSLETFIVKNLRSSAADRDVMRVWRLDP